MPLGQPSVPATRRSLTDYPPASLYLDTSFLLNALIPDYPFHAAASAFLVNVADAERTRLYVSTLVWIEFAHVVMQPRFHQGLPPDVQAAYSLAHWDLASVRDAYLTAMLERLQDLLEAFGWYEIEVTADIRVHALQLMAQYDLDGHDATHVASAQAAKLTDVVSFDSDFRRVDGLILWSA
jgi:predicted nucleic acid-binding protein